jgi:hypothetical protein
MVCGGYVVEGLLSHQERGKKLHCKYCLAFNKSELPRFGIAT